MSKDLARIAEAVLEEEFPSDSLTLDETVEVVNIAACMIQSHTSVMARKAAGNAFILWLGGVNPDIFVYGAQLLIKRHGVNFRFDEKSHARMERIEDKFLEVQGYDADNFHDIVHYAWPQEWADDSTFEERLDELAEDFASDESPADMLLTGMHVPEDLDYNQRFQLVDDCVKSLSDYYSSNGENILFRERLDRFFGWMLTIEIELASYGLRCLLAREQVQFDMDKVPNWDEFCELLQPITLETYKSESY